MMYEQLSNNCDWFDCQMDDLIDEFFPRMVADGATTLEIATTKEDKETPLEIVTTKKDKVTPLEIVTMTVKATLGQKVDLCALALFLPRGNVIYDPKSTAFVAQKSFANQAEIKMRCGHRIVSISVFRTGVLRIAGVKSFQEAEQIFKKLLSRIQRAQNLFSRRPQKSKFNFVRKQCDGFIVSAVPFPSELVKNNKMTMEMSLCNSVFTFTKPLTLNQVNAKLQTTFQTKTSTICPAVIVSVPVPGGGSVTARIHGGGKVFLQCGNKSFHNTVAFMDGLKHVQSVLLQHLYH